MMDEDACHLRVSVDREARSVTLTGNVAAWEYLAEAGSALGGSRRTTSDQHFWISHPEEALITLVLDAREDNHLANTLRVDVDETEAVMIVGNRQGLSCFGQRVVALLNGSSTRATRVLEKESLTPESWQLTVVVDPTL